VARQQDLERLYTFGRAILLIDTNEPFAKQVCQKLADTFGLTAAALYERSTGQIYRAGPLEFEGMDMQLRETALQGTSFSDPQRNRVITAVRLGADPIASLALQGTSLSDSVLQSIANMVAIGLERARAQELAQDIEITRRSERLRTTLIDAMAHELKTPLTAVRAATSALLATPDQKLSNAVQMLKIADEEAAHLEELIDNALDVTQLDSDHIDVDLEISDLESVPAEVVASMKSKIGDRSVEVISSEQLPAVAFDRRLIKLATKQLLDNALKYSPPDKPVTIHGFSSDGTVGFDITDHGAGISPEEQTHIFQRFYRGSSVQNHITGFGLGLSIAHRIMQAHGGDLTVRSRPGETTFRLTLPVQRANKGRAK
jgi:two-component system sensor histidine kinase KdpD